MANTATSTYASELALAEMPWVRLGIDEDVPFTKRMQATSWDVKSDGSAYYIQVGKTGKIGYPMRTIASEGSTAVPAWAVATPYLAKWSLGEFANQVRITTRGKTQGMLISEASITGQVMKDHMAQAAFFKNRILMGDPSGYLCKVTAYVDANTLKVDDLSALREGLVIDSYDALSSGTQGIDSKTISAIDFEAETITVTSHGLGATDVDWLFIEDDYGDHPEGLLSLLAGTSTREADNGVTVTPAEAAYAGLTRASTAKFTSFAKKLPWGKFDPKYWPQFLSEAAMATNVSQLAWTAIYGSLKAEAALLEALEYDKKAMGDTIVYGSNKPVQLRSIYFKNGALDVVPFWGIGDHKLLCVDETKMGIRQPPEGNGWVGADSGNIWTDNARETTGYPTLTAAWIESYALIGDPFAHALLYNFSNIS